MSGCALPVGGPIGESAPAGHIQPTPTPFVGEATPAGPAIRVHDAPADDSTSGSSSAGPGRYRHIEDIMRDA